MSKVPRRDNRLLVRNVVPTSILYHVCVVTGLGQIRALDCVVVRSKRFRMDRSLIVYLSRKCTDWSISETRVWFGTGSGQLCHQSGGRVTKCRLGFSLFCWKGYSKGVFVTGAGSGVGDEQPYRQTVEMGTELNTKTGRLLGNGRWTAHVIDLC